MKSITTKYHGPTNSRGSRVSATDGDSRIALSWDSALDSDANHDAAAKALCLKLGWANQSLMRGNHNTGNVYVFDSHANRVRFTSEEQELGREMHRKSVPERMAKWEREPRLGA